MRKHELIKKMSKYTKIFAVPTLILTFICVILAIPQSPETTPTSEAPTSSSTAVIEAESPSSVNPSPPNVSVKINEISVDDKPKKFINDHPLVEQQRTTEDVNIFIKVYRFIIHPIKTFILLPKVKSVLKNIGTCVVNGAMELITHFLPAPLIPIIASTAGMMIPFEPVVMLRERMPVTSYRRAFQSAVNSFMGTFDDFKPEDQDDPYNTRKFNRRFLKENTNEKDNIMVVGN